MEGVNKFGVIVHITKVIGLIIVNILKEEWYLLKEIFMKGNGKMIKFMDLYY